MLIIQSTTLIMSNPWTVLADVGESFADYLQKKDDNHFQDYLLALNLSEKFLVWLYSPIISLSIDNIRTIKSKYNVPDNVIILKLMAHYIHEFSDDTCEDDIFHNVKEKLMASGLLENFDPDSFKSLYDRCKHVKLRDVGLSKVKQIVKMSNTDLKAIWAQDHKGYPLPHPKLGRPQIGYCICLFDGCNHKFPDGDALKNHL